MREIYSGLVGLISAILLLLCIDRPVIKLHGPNSKDVIDIFHVENNKTFRLRPYILACPN